MSFIFSPRLLSPNLTSQTEVCIDLELFNTERRQALYTALWQDVLPQCTTLRGPVSKINSLDSLLLLLVNGDITSFHPVHCANEPFIDNKKQLQAKFNTWTRVYRTTRPYTWSWASESQQVSLLADNSIKFPVILLRKILRILLRQTLPPLLVEFQKPGHMELVWQRMQDLREK